MIKEKDLNKVKWFLRAELISRFLQSFKLINLFIFLLTLHLTNSIIQKNKI
jgi:hypothetical protein